MRKVKITGMNGYLGSVISRKLVAKGYMVSGIQRELLYGSTQQLSNELKGSDIIINLAGASILQRWTKKNKEIIYESRVKTTSNLVQAINLLNEKDRPKKFISASAIGIYQSGKLHDENSTIFENGFVGKVAKEWEDSLIKLPDSIQKNIFRIGLVLGKNAKTIKNLLLPFKLGIGGTIGNGKQAFPYIHELDLVNAFVWVIEKFEKSDTFNLVAPECISNKVFTKSLSKNLNRPAFFPVPGFALRIFYGEAASLLLESPAVEPKRLLEEGFRFKFPTIEATLSEIIS